MTCINHSFLLDWSDRQVYDNEKYISLSSVASRETNDGILLNSLKLKRDVDSFH